MFLFTYETLYLDSVICRNRLHLHLYYTLQSNAKAIDAKFGVPINHFSVIFALIQVLICAIVLSVGGLYTWRATTMSISYNKMWKLLIDKNMKRKDLKEKAEVSQNVMARLSKNQAVTMETMEKICSVLQCDIGDVMEFIPDEIA